MNKNFVLPDSELPVELVEPVEVAEHSETERRLWMASILVVREREREAHS